MKNRNNLAALFRSLPGLYIVVLTLFLEDLNHKLILFSFACLLTLVKKQKIRVFFIFIFLGFVTLINSFPPRGKVLFSVFSLPFTSEALLGGMKKGVNLLTLFYAAKLTISRDIVLPGALGSLLSGTFYYWQLLRERFEKVSPTHFMAQLDDFLLKLEGRKADDGCNFSPISFMEAFLTLGSIIAVTIIIALF